MPRRKHGTGGRSLKKVLDARREREADIRFAPYVRPFGARGLAYARRPGVNGEVLVSNGQGITFRPGTLVPIASHSGEQGEVIIGVPPPNRRGGVSTTPINIAKTVPAPQTIYAFWYRSLTSTVITQHDIDGNFLAVAAELSIGVVGGNGPSYPQGTSTGKVLFTNQSNGEMYLWDPVNPTTVVTHVPETVAGSTGLPILAPVWYDGAAHWVEFEQDGTNYTWRLRNSADFVTIADIASKSGLISGYFGGYTSGDVEVQAGSAHTKDYVHFMSRLTWDFTNVAVYIRLNRSDTGHTDSVTASYGDLPLLSGFALPHPTSSNYSVVGSSTGVTTSLVAKYTGDPPTLGEQWPVTAGFQIGSYVGLSSGIDSSNRVTASYSLGTSSIRVVRDALIPVGSLPALDVELGNDPSGSYPAHTFRGAAIV